MKYRVLYYDFNRSTLTGDAAVWFHTPELAVSRAREWCVEQAGRRAYVVSECTTVASRVQVYEPA